MEGNNEKKKTRRTAYHEQRIYGTENQNIEKMKRKIVRGNCRAIREYVRVSGE